MPTGDKVIFPLLNQRVDKKDLNDMQTLIQETVGRTLASLLGEGGGALTTIPFTWNQTTDIVTFGPFMVAYSNPRDTTTNFNLLDGGVVIHDPNRPGQNGFSTVELVGIGVSGHLWFKRFATDTDFDNRAYWPGPSAGEQVAGTNTREREHVRFAATSSVTNAEYNNVNGWWRFASFQKVSLLGQTTVLISPVSAIGDDRGAGTADAAQLMGLNASTTSGQAATRKWGLNRLAQDVISNILRMKDSDVTFDPTTGSVAANPNDTRWRDQPTIGLKQASEYIADLQSTLEDIQADLQDYAIITERIRSVQAQTPLILGFIDLSVTWLTSNQSVVSLATRVGGGSSAGAGLFTAELVSDPSQYLHKIKITVGNSAIIDHIAGACFMSLGDSTFEDYEITGSTHSRSLVSGKISYPKTSVSVPLTSTGEGSATPSDPDYVTTGQFVITAKVVRGTDNNEVEPFTLIVYGRNASL
jgi:hypothetical protein